MNRVLTGIQSSGTPHLGNVLGAMLPAIELSKNNIRVNTIHPDCVYDTDVWSDKILKARANQYGISVKEYKSRNLLKTAVSSKDVSEIVTFFVSNKSKKTR